MSHPAFPPNPRNLRFQGWKKGEILSINMVFVIGVKTHPEGGCILIQKDPIYGRTNRIRVRANFATVTKKWERLNKCAL